MESEQTRVRAQRLGRAGAPPAIAWMEGKGHVSVNPVYGCGQGCPFCISQADGWDCGGRAGRQLASVPQLVEALVARREPLAALRLSLVDFADPFERALVHTTQELLEGIGQHLPGQAVLLTSRLHPGEAVLDRLAGLRRLRLSVFVSLGDATGVVPPVTPVRPRLDLLAGCKQRGLHAVTLLRPLVREWVQPAALRDLLAEAVVASDELVMAGLQLAPAIRESLQRAGWPVPSRPCDEYGGVEVELRDEVLALAGELGAGLPVSEHRSCAINRHHGLACQVAGPQLEPVLCCGFDQGLEAEPLYSCRYHCRFDVRSRDAAGYCLLRAA